MHLVQPDIWLKKQLVRWNWMSMYIRSPAMWTAANPISNVSVQTRSDVELVN